MSWKFIDPMINVKRRAINKILELYGCKCVTYNLKILWMVLFPALCAFPIHAQVESKGNILLPTYFRDSVVAIES